MFSGVIKARALISELRLRRNGASFVLLLDQPLDTVAGSSLCCSGVCLTVTKCCGRFVDVEAWRDSLRLTALAIASRLETLNVEVVLTADGQLHGHVVCGHVRCVVQLEAVDKAEAGAEAKVVRLRCPKWVSEVELAPWSSSLDGVSITVAEAGCRWIQILLISYTLATTSLVRLTMGRELSLE
ncbi:MAG: hypothetical protein ACKERG_01805 [Candidatus Hodgkinia cicadicola]